MPKRFFPRHLMILAIISLSLHLLASVSSTEPFISASDIDAYLTQESSPLAGLGSVFVEEGIRFDIDPRLVVAITGAETTFGTNIGCNAPFNAWSWFWNDPNDCPNNQLDSWEDGIHFVTRQMSLYRTRLLQEGMAFTIQNIGSTYCAEGCEHWEPNVTRFYSDELGGDISDLGFSEAAPTVEPPWPMFQHDPQQTGHSPDTSITFPLTKDWTYPAVVTSSPIIADGTVYIGNAVDGKVHALDAFQGTPKWIYNAGAALTCWSAALVSTDRVFISSDPGCTSAADGSFLYVLKANPTSPDGELIQRIPLGPSPRSSLLPPPILFDGTVYVASSNTIWGFDAETFNLVWPSPITIPDDPITGIKFVLSAPAVTQNTLVVGTSGSCSTCKTLFAFDRATGTQKWSNVVTTSPVPSTANGLVYVRSGVGGQSSNLIAFDEDTGAEAWRKDVGTGFNWAIPAIASGIVYVASGFHVYAFDAVDGAPVWPAPVRAVAAGNCDFAATIAFSIFAIANDKIFIKSNNACGVAKVYAISTADGSLLWNSGDLLSRGGDTSTPVVANGWLYFVLLDTPTNSGTLYAYSPQ